ncbi:MAG: hypothetical protein LW636_04370 [Planctomycetaceae bacterium]|nr:hypothetical protein [Planctomycetaceae bacterium]
MSLSPTGCRPYSTSFTKSSGELVRLKLPARASERLSVFVSLRYGWHIELARPLCVP